MLYLKWHVLLTAVGTTPVELLQHVLADLVSCQRTLLIRHACDFRILHTLGVKAPQFLRDGRNRTQPHEAPDPRHRGINPMLQAWREPSCWPCPIEKPWLSVTRLALPPIAPDRTPVREFLFDLLAAMR
jgi:hypothetical protein